MSVIRPAVLVCCIAALAFGQGLPLEPRREGGNSVTGAFEGWFRNPDGTFSILLGYFNRNQKQQVDIPIGPNNRIEPGGPDQGQPTHFETGRGWGMFTIQVPADFGDKKLTWTLVVNGHTTVISPNLKTEYEVSPFSEAAVGNTPPVLSFEEKGPSAQGQRPLSVQRTAKVGIPLPLDAWISDDGKFNNVGGIRKPRDQTPPMTVRWVQYRGPARVTFRQERPPVQIIERPAISTNVTGKANTTATFSEPGEYVLNLTVNDYSGEGGGGFQCCWTTGKVKVSVTQ